MLNKIRECAAAALMDGEAVAGRLNDTCEAEQNGRREAWERSLAKDEERIEVLEKMVLRLYEDMVAGRITENNFHLLLQKTQNEQAELKAKVEDGRKRLADEIRLAVDARQWVESIQEYRDITELDAATLNRLIKEIVVHESIGSDKMVLVYKCGQEKLNNLYYQVKEQRRCSTWRRTKNLTLRNSSSRSWICTMPGEPRIHNWNVNMA